MEDIIKTFAVRLKEAMKINGMTQYSLAKALNIPQSTISRYLNGKREASISYLVQICSALDVTPNFLLGFSDIY